MLTKSDKKFLKANFATKDDLKSFATKNDLVAMEKRQDKKFNGINTELKHIKGSLDKAIDVFDRQITYHHKRLVDIEKKTGLDEQPYFPPIN